MSTTDPKLSRRDKIEGELAACVGDHEGIRKLLKLIDKAAPGLIRHTAEIRNHLLDMGQRYHRIREEMTVSTMVGEAEFGQRGAAGGQRPVNELALFVGLDESPETRRAFAHQLEVIGDDTLRGDERNVLSNEEVSHA